MTKSEDNKDIIIDLVAGGNPPINRIYKPEFACLAPPLLNCQDEVSEFYFKF